MGFYYDFENADAFATGAIGTPGERTFYMQVRADGRTVSVKCEKQQVAALAQYLRNMLADMPDMTGSVNNATATLQNPVEQDFVLGSVGLGVDRSNMRMVVQLEEMILVDEDDDDVFDLLDDEDQQLADSLQQMIILAQMDNLMGDCNDAKQLLKKFAL